MGRRDWGLLLFLSLLWGGSFFCVELALAGGLGAMPLVWLRVTLAAGVLALVLWATGRPFPRGRAVWGAIVVMGLLNNAGPFTLFALAQGQIGGGLAAILNAMTPILTVLALAGLAGERRPGAGRIVGVVAGFLGVLVMMGGGVTGGVLWAKVACLGAAGCYALASVWGRRFRALGVDPLAVAFGQCAAAAGLLLVPAVASGGAAWRAAGADVWAAVGALAVLSTALAYVIFFRLLRDAGAVNVALVTFLIPVSAVILGAVFLGERLEARHLAGAGLIALGLVALDGRVGRWIAARLGGRVST